jgi:hypothetical protein
MQTIESEPESATPCAAACTSTGAAAAAPRDLVFDLSRIYLEVGLKPADALRSALADFDCYFRRVSSCAI